MTFKDKDNDGVIDTSDIKQINHYYPFSLNMEGNWNGSFAEAKNKYQYNGIEMNNDFGLDLNMAFYRGYDASLGRWWQIDCSLLEYKEFKRTYQLLLSMLQFIIYNDL